MGGSAAGAWGFVDGLAPGEGGVDGEEAFEREDGHLEEVEGEQGEDAGEDKGEQGTDDVVVVAGVGVGDLGTEVVVEGFEEDVVDVEAVADAAEPAERGPAEDFAGKARAENERDGGGGGDAEGGEAEPELDRVGDIQGSAGNAGHEVDGEAAEEGMQRVFADETVGTRLATYRINAIAHGEGECAAEGDGAPLGEHEVVVKVVGDGTDERGKDIDGHQEELADGKEPEAETKGVAAAVGEKDDERPDEVELFFNGEGPEVVERQRGGGTEGVGGEVGEVLQEEDEDEQWPKLDKVGAGVQGSAGGGEQGEDVNGKDAESAVDVEVTQALKGVAGLPKRAGDEEAGEGEEEDDAAPAELSEVAEEALGGVGGLEAAAVVKDEDEKDG